jgi:Flp pilus assembly protein protease CpaA
MEEVYVLFGIALVWTIAAVVQDMRTKEISNWLNYSFISTAFAARAFVSINSGELSFFFFGFLGFVLFFVLAMAFYYSGTFGGGDARLLMGFGIILPYTSYFEVIEKGFLFVLFLFLAGFLWTIIYSFFVIVRDANKFGNYFRKYFVKFRFSLIGLFFFFVVSFFFEKIIFYLSGFLLLFGVVYIYVKAIDDCLVIRKSAKELSEGEWLYNDIRVGKRLISKSVHGLSKEEIRFLINKRKAVLIKDGPPFTPAFLVAFIFMVFFWANGLFQISSLLAFLV